MTKYVAIQFVGLVRGFKDEKVRNNIYNKLIKPLKEQGYVVHIFWHTYDIEFDEIIHNVDKNKFNVKKIQIDKDQKIQCFLENEFNLFDRYRFPPSWAKAANVDTGTGGIVEKSYHHFGWFKYLYSIQEVNKLRNKYEKENNIKYEWVINTQFQLSPQNTIDNLTTLDTTFMYTPGYAQFNGYYDSFFISNVIDSNYMGDFYKYMITEEFKKDSNIKYLHSNKNYIDSEPLFKAYIDKKCIMKPTLCMRFHRIRYNGLIINH